MHWDRIGVYRSPIGAAFHDNTIHLNLTHGNCRNVVREAGILGNSRKDFVRLAPLNESDAENMQNLPPLCLDPFRFRHHVLVAGFLPGSVGVVAPISRYNYTSGYN